MVVTAAIWVLFVVAALRPPFRHGPLGFAVFVLTLTFTEIPLLLLVVFVVSIAFTGRPEELPWTAVSAVLDGTTVAGLIWLQLRARNTRTALEVGLDQGLGRQWRTAQPSGGPARQLPPTPWWPGILLPFQRRTKAVIRVRNLSYGPDRAHRVDLYRGRDSAHDTHTVRPVLIHLHGGGFVSGTKSRGSLALLNHLAGHGWTCLSADYRLRADGQHPNPLVDTKRLIAWIRKNSAEFRVDPSKVYLAGCSAGGHLAVSAGLTPNATEFQPGFEAAETGVAGVIVWYPYLGPRTPDPSSSPAALAQPDAPPMLIVHGANDTAISSSSTRGGRGHPRQVPQCGRLRRTAAHPTQLRPLRLGSFPNCRNRRQGIPRLDPAPPQGLTCRHRPETLTGATPTERRKRVREWYRAEGWRRPTRE